MSRMALLLLPITTGGHFDYTDLWNSRQRDWFGCMVVGPSADRRQRGRLFEAWYRHLPQHARGDAAFDGSRHLRTG
jgi:hypothetical protein